MAQRNKSWKETAEQQLEDSAERERDLRLANLFDRKSRRVEKEFLM
jgi:hypothetical protein